MTVAVTVAGETLHLFPERALYWPRANTLLVADIHVGKAATFQAAAIPLPAGTTEESLSRLSALLDQTGAQQLVILGDLLHARQGRSEQTIEQVCQWRLGYANLNILLVRGNHDVHAGDPPPSWRMLCVDDPWLASPFVYRHLPQATDTGYVLAGHLHPAVSLQGKGRQQMRLPCFHFTDRVGTLPAFGAFTGSSLIHPRRQDRVYVVAEEQVIQITPR